MDDQERKTIVAQLHERTLEVAKYAAREIIETAVRHPEAPEGIEFFRWTWVPANHFPVVNFARVPDNWHGAFGYDAAKDAEPITPEMLYDEVHAGPLMGDVYISVPLGTRKLPWRVGWNRAARKAVLWFADGPPRLKPKS